MADLVRGDQTIERNAAVRHGETGGKTLAAERQRIGDARGVAVELSSGEQMREAGGRKRPALSSQLSQLFEQRARIGGRGQASREFTGEIHRHDLQFDSDLRAEDSLHVIEASENRIAGLRFASVARQIGRIAEDGNLDPLRGHTGLQRLRPGAQLADHGAIGGGRVARHLHRIASERNAPLQHGVREFEHHRAGRAVIDRLRRPIHDEQFATVPDHAARQTVVNADARPGTRNAFEGALVELHGTTGGELRETLVAGELQAKAAAERGELEYRGGTITNECGSQVLRMLRYEARGRAAQCWPRRGCEQERRAARQNPK